MFRYFVINRLALFAAILSIGIFILATIVITSTLSLLGFYLAGSVPFFNSYILDIINNLSTFSLFVVAFTCTFKWLPDAVVSWRAAAFGGVVTGALFVPGKMAMQWFITGSTYDLYGAASSLVIFLVFLYYSAQIFFIGAESTYVFACRHGEKIKPSDDAIPFTIKEHVPKKHEAKDKKKSRG
jgi:membrane protein